MTGFPMTGAGIPELTYLRLVNGPSHCAGRVELLHNQLWGTVCDDFWDLDEARVVCRQLGCGTALSAPRGSRYGQGTDRMWLDEVYCTGREAVLSNCWAPPWGERNCTSRKDAGVVCSGSNISEVAELRLVNGSSHCTGRVEVFHNLQWGTVCDDSWDLQDAGVVCRQLGCGTALSTPAISEQIPLRLVNGPSHCAGRVEVLLNEQWGPVCDDGWDVTDAGVVCRQLGCGTALSAPGGARFGQGSGNIWLDDVSCTGTEAALSDCWAQPWGTYNCKPGEEAGVVCSDATILKQFPLRLMNGPSRCAGRVEVLLNEQWGTVCDDNWDISDAGVVCRQLECGVPLSAPGRARFGQGSGNIWLDDISCAGTEAALSDCKVRLWGDSNCTHGEEAGVVCSDQGPLRLRLTNGSNSCSGRVEVLINTTWGAVCDAGWGLPEAGVLCKQLGCGTVQSALGVQFGQGAGDIWLDSVRCSGQESLISECLLSQLDPGQCGRGYKASVVCARQAGLEILYYVLIGLGALVVLICGALLCWRMRRNRASGNSLGHVNMEELGAPGTRLQPQGGANPEPPREPNSEITRLVKENPVL
ncbi:deleted in malignant brain tumors 1 protein-like [Mauremys mutica]|uniref:deleted in malignant brain tumors 1 protein-like n=1 Tax=Mauremys mutica TaxID=74926 RepID=UPI001D166526|nr:deleted in malignant brain tumors 1 protein-like [Mauremys mutica]